MLVYGGMGAFALFRTMRRPLVPKEAGPVVQVSPVTTGVTAQAIADDASKNEGRDIGEASASPALAR